MHELLAQSVPHAAPSRFDDRVKLWLALSAVAAAIASNRLILPISILTAAVACLFASPLPLHRLARRMIGPVLLACLLGLLKSFAAGGPVLYAGLAEGVRLAARVLASLSVLLWLSATMPPWRFFAALRASGLPAVAVEIALLMQRYIFLLLDESATVRSAQRVRLGYRGARRSLASAGTLAGIVLTRALDQADRTAQAMAARGYRGSMPLPPPPPLPVRQTVLAAVFIIALAAATVTV